MLISQPPSYKFVLQNWYTFPVDTAFCLLCFLKISSEILNFHLDLNVLL